MVKVNEDGSVTVHIGKIDMGTAPRFGIPLIAAEELGVPVNDVTVVNVDTDASPWDAGTVGSRAIIVSGTATQTRRHRRAQSDLQNGRQPARSQP